MSPFFKKNPLSFILEWNQSRFSARVSYFEFEDVVICKVNPLNGVCPSAFSLGLLHYARLFNVERIKCEVHDFFSFLLSCWQSSGLWMPTHQEMLLGLTLGLRGLPFEDTLLYCS